MDEFLASCVPALGHALLHFLWQGALIGALAALALHTLRHARPQARYAVACIALLACVLVPLFSVTAHFVAPSFQATHAGTLAPFIRVDLDPRAPAVPFGFAPMAPSGTALPWVVALWAAGACIMFSRMAVGLAWVRRLRHSPQGADHVAWQSRLDALALHFGLRRHVALRLVDALDSPVSAGWWRPVVVLPASLLTRMPADLIEALLAHELAHIHRHDYVVNLLQSAIEALLFYHPVTWWLSRRIRIEREQIADELATEVACSPRNLALALSELAELQRPRPVFTLAQAAHGGHLMARIQQLLRPARRDHPGARFAFPLLGLAAACMAFYSYAQIGTSAAPLSASPSVASPPAQVRAMRETFALVRKGDHRITLWGPDDDMTEAQAAGLAQGGDLLWVRRDGRDYVVTDPSLLARAQQAWHQADALSQRMETLGRQMDAHDRNVEAISGRMEALSMPRDTRPGTEAMKRETDALERQLQDIQRQQRALIASHGDGVASDAAQQRFERELDALVTQHRLLEDRWMRRHEQQLSAEAERSEARQHAMDALAREIDVASQPMATLGRQIEALRREEEDAAERAARETKNLFNDAMAKGLAKPASPPLATQ